VTTHRLRAALVLAAVLTLAAAPVLAHDPEPKPASEAEPSPGAAADPAAAVEAAGTPGEHHAVLERLAGTWNVEILFWPAAGAEPVKTVGMVVNEMIMDGRFLESRFKGTIDGRSFVGTGHEGYDDARGKYVSTWIDSLSTGMAYAEGAPTENPNVIVTRGTTADPATGAIRKTKNVTTIRSASVYTFEMFESADGEDWTNTMKIVYTRIEKS